MERHDQITETGYDSAFGHYRGEVDIEYVPVSGDYSATTTLKNPTQAQVDATMDSMANADAVAQRGGRPSRSSRGGGGPASNPNWVLVTNSRGQRQWRYFPGGATWRDLTGKSPTPVRGEGFGSYSTLKRRIGSAGHNREWHHIVEQTPENISRFGPDAIHNTTNIMSLEYRFHRQVSGYYSSIQPFTGGRRVRDWLSTRSYQYQHEFGVRLINSWYITCAGCNPHP
jgi:hypothetical protein